MGRSKWILLIAIVVLVLIQFIRPNFTNPPVNPRETMQTAVAVPPNRQAICAWASAR